MTCLVVVHYLEGLGVLPGTLAKRGGLPSGTGGGITPKSFEATFVIIQAWIPQKSVIIARCFGLQAAKLEWVSHTSATPAGLPARAGICYVHTAFENIYWVAMMRVKPYGLSP